MNCPYRILIIIIDLRRQRKIDYKLILANHE
jgi:hypothetical protein